MWRPYEAEDAFDDCLARLRGGATVEACLGAYPQLSAALAPLLTVAQGLLALAATGPDTAPALAHIRARFLRQTDRQE